MPNTIPMYVFTGFLESGKTKFIQETLEDERFNAGEKTLLLVFEEGEEEYDISTYPSQNVYIETLEYEDLSEESWRRSKKHHAERVIVELNGMHLAADFISKRPTPGRSRRRSCSRTRTRFCPTIRTCAS